MVGYLAGGGFKMIHCGELFRIVNFVALKI